MKAINLVTAFSFVLCSLSLVPNAEADNASVGRQERVYAIAALNLVRTLKMQLDTNASGRAIFGSDTANPASAASELVAAFYADLSIPDDEKGNMTTNNKVYCLGFLSPDGFSTQVNEVYLQVLATAPSYDMTAREVEKLKRASVNALSCMRLD